MDEIPLLGQISYIQDVKLRICWVAKSMPAAKSETFVNISGSEKSYMGKIFGIWFFFIWKDKVI